MSITYLGKPVTDVYITDSALFAVYGELFIVYGKGIITILPISTLGAWTKVKEPTNLPPKAVTLPIGSVFYSVPGLEGPLPYALYGYSKCMGKIIHIRHNILQECFVFNHIE